jgi:hypothetical protein
MITAPKTMLTVLLGIHDLIFIDWFPPREKFKNGYFGEKYSRYFPRSCTAGAVQIPQDR